MTFYLMKAECPNCLETVPLGYESEEQIPLMQDVPVPPYCPECGIHVPGVGEWDVFEELEVEPTDPTEPPVKEGNR